MKEQVTAIIESFERETISESSALTKLREITGRVIDADWLRHYWRSESTEDFVDRLCAVPILNHEQITAAEAIALISEYLKAGTPGASGQH